ncbi:MAG: TetR/AcrR family transcriptional regulator [Acidimicrobiales bacterium]|nr:TetR/AcrR family transcriptional regulator [Acidimicrobiales bacterium]
MGPSSARDKMLEATYGCMARTGISKLTLEDAAKEAGVSRATLYRYFPGGRDQLIADVIAWAAFRWIEGLAAAVEGVRDFEELAVTAVMFAHESLQKHEVLQMVLKDEPEIVLPLLTVEATRIVAFVHIYIVTRLFGRTLPENLDTDNFAEYTARMMLSLIASPGRWDLTDKEQVRMLVRAELIAVLGS